MNNEDLLFLLGVLVTQLEGEVTITAESQMKFVEGVTKKELLFKDNGDKTLTIKLADKEEVKEEK